MLRRLIQAASIASLVLAPGAAIAAGSFVDIPEPGDLALFAMGVIGLLFGRHQSRKRRSASADHDA